MAEAVVDLLEVVEVGENDRKRPAETLDARELDRELVLEVAAVRQAGQTVDPSLLLDDSVQARVVERNDCLGGERCGGLPVVIAERFAEEGQGPEVDAPGLERHLDAIGGVLDGAGPHDVARCSHEHAGGCTARLDRGLDDDATKLVVVVGCGQRISEPREGSTQSRPFGVELVEARLELRRHLVERAPEHRKLVATLGRDALSEVAPCNRMRRLDETADRPDDRTALEVRDDRHDYERDEQTDQQAADGAAIRRVDRALRADDPEGRDRPGPRGAGDQRPITRSAKPDRAGRAGRQPDTVDDRAQPCGDGAVAEQDDSVLRIDPGSRREPVDESRIQRHSRDHQTADTPAGTDDRNLAGRSVADRRPDAEAGPGCDGQERVAAE